MNTDKRDDMLRKLDALLQKADPQSGASDALEAMTKIGPYTFLHVGHADDVLLFNRYRYYVLGEPSMSDYDYDQLERMVVQAFPNAVVPTQVGSACHQDYPVYIREFRWPNENERAHRDWTRYGIKSEKPFIEKLIHTLRKAL